MEKGDDDNAYLLEMMCHIYHTLTKGNPCITIREELELSQMYLDLFLMQHPDNLNITIDTDPELMEYGVIRNLLQPLLENYFVHAFDEHKEENKLSIWVCKENADTLELGVSDNGKGISDEKLSILNQKLKLEITQ